MKSSAPILILFQQLFEKLTWLDSESSPDIIQMFTLISSYFEEIIKEVQSGLL